MKNATLRYALINISYFAVFCGIHAYASVFLLSKGFTNTQIGIVLALANILSVLAQPIVAGLIDKPGVFTNRNVSIASTVLLIIGSILLYFIANSFVVIFIIYALIYMIQMLYQPLIIAMNFEYTKAGARINFGLARGLGSFGFAVTSLIFGQIISNIGVASIQLIDAGLLAASMVMLATFVLPDSGDGASCHTLYRDNSSVPTSTAATASPVAHNNFFDFVKTYPKFMLFILGSVCFFFAHNTLNDYLIQIITPIGGDEAKMGYAIFVAAALELPTMACIGFLTKKTSCSNLLIISGFFFGVKTLCMLLAQGMAMVYISQACQLAAYALFIPASAYYVDEVMEELDKVKGQAYINVAITLGGVFSNLICGRILDVSGVFVMLLTALFVSIAGLVIVVFAVKEGRSPSAI